MSHIPLLKDSLPIKELSQQRYVWALTGIWHKQPKTTHYNWSLLNNRNICNKYTITLRNKFDALHEYEDFVKARIEAAVECRSTKLRSKHRGPWETLAVKKKRDNVKTASVCNKSNPTNANAQKHKKAQRELINTFQKEQIHSRPDQ